MDTTSDAQTMTLSDSRSSTPTPLEPVVATLVSKYQHIEVIHPLLQKVFESPTQKDLFISVMQHDYNRLITRSQKLEDHELNVYEKAFCLLMQNGEDRIGGLEIYVEKILGIGVGTGEGCASEQGKEAWMMKGVAVRALLERGKLVLAHLVGPSPLYTPYSVSTNNEAKH